MPTKTYTLTFSKHCQVVFPMHHHPLAPPSPIFLRATMYSCGVTPAASTLRLSLPPDRARLCPFALSGRRHRTRATWRITRAGTQTCAACCPGRPPSLRGVGGGSYTAREARERCSIRHRPAESRHRWWLPRAGHSTSRWISATRPAARPASVTRGMISAQPQVTGWCVCGGGAGYTGGGLMVPVQPQETGWRGAGYIKVDLMVPVQPFNHR